MDAYGKLLRLRLFIEGVEIPVIAVQVQTAPNGPAVCSIQIPPVMEATHLLPRSLIHVYFYGTSDVESTIRNDRITSQEADPTIYSRAQAKTKSGESQDANLLNSFYKLLFVGELVGFTWTKNQSARSIVLQCMDLSNYWDYAYQWSNHDLFGPGVKALFSGGGTNLFSDLLLEDGSVLLGLLHQPSVQYPNVKGLLGGMLHVLEAIGGSYYINDNGDSDLKGKEARKKRKRFAGQNMFFSLAELRLHIMQMITAYPEDNTAKKLLGFGGFDGLMGRTLGQLGQQVSIRAAINAIGGVIFHESYSQPCPLFVPGTSGTANNTDRLAVTDDPHFEGLLELVASWQAGLKALSANATTYSTIGNFASQRRDDLVRLNQMKKAMKDAALVAYDSPQFQKVLETAGGLTARALTKLRDAASPTSAEAMADEYDKILQALDQAQYAVVEVNTRVDFVPGRLNQQIFRPDVWFTAPPRCNVLFPDMYETVSYARNFLQEPTRLLLKTSQEFWGEDEFFDHLYFAPKIASLKSQKADLQSTLSTDLMPHEIYTGILPVFEKMGEFNIFAVRSAGKDPSLKGIGLAQRSCNFIYFKHRFANRQLEIKGRFNPYVACGFPGVVIDKYVNPATINTYMSLFQQSGGQRDPLIDRLLGTHFLGSFTQVSHSVDQSQGSTQIACSYPRQVDESMEFLGVTQSETIGEMQADGSRVQTSRIAYPSPPPAGSLGPNEGPILTAIDVTHEYTVTDSRSARKLPALGNASLQVPVGVSQPIKDYPADVRNALMSTYEDEDVVVLFHAYEITEEVPRFRQRRDKVASAEELIRPGWYGDVWKSDSIGKAYQYFFKTGAITDQQDAEIARVNPTDDASPLMPTLTAGSSVEQAVYYLVLIYSIIKSHGFDSEAFVRGYTWRPIATMVDMFGSDDLMLDPITQRPIRGVEGFHSRAFGPFTNLFGLVNDDISSILGIKRGEKSAALADVRGPRHDAALAVLSALQFSRAILG